MAKKPSSPPQKNEVSKKKRYITTIGAFTAGMIIIIMGEIFLSGPSPYSLHNPTSIDTKYNNKLIYLTGNLKGSTISDSTFAFDTEALFLKRIVEVYQWQKGNNNQYNKVWSEEYINNAETPERINPVKRYFAPQLFQAKTIALGEYILSPELIAQIQPDYISEPLTQSSFSQLHPEGQKAFTLHDGMYYFSLNPAAPEIGDIRIRFMKSSGKNVTILAKPQGNSLLPYTIGNHTIEKLVMGQSDQETMLRIAQMPQHNLAIMITRSTGGILILAGIFLLMATRKNHLRLTTPPFSEAEEHFPMHMTNHTNEKNQNRVDTPTEQIQEKLFEENEPEKSSYQNPDDGYQEESLTENSSTSDTIYETREPSRKKQKNSVNPEDLPEGVELIGAKTITKDTALYEENLTNPYKNNRTIPPSISTEIEKERPQGLPDGVDFVGPDELLKEQKKNSITEKESERNPESHQNRALEEAEAFETEEEFIPFTIDEDDKNSPFVDDQKSPSKPQEKK